MEWKIAYAITVKVLPLFGQSAELTQVIVGNLPMHDGAVDVVIILFRNKVLPKRGMIQSIDASSGSGMRLRRQVL